MKKIFIFSIVVLMTASLSFSQKSTGESAPGFSLNNCEGDQVSLEDYEGRVLVLVFLDKNSSKSLLLAKSTEQQINESGNSANILGILKNANSQQAADWKEGIGVKYPILLDRDGQIWNKYIGGINGDLRIFIIDKEGAIRYRSSQFNAEEIENTISSLQSASIKTTTWWRLKQMFRKK